MKRDHFFQLLSFKTGILALALLTGLTANATRRVGMNELSLVETWEHPANGVWKTEVGDMSGELRYTDLAAEEARIDSLNTLSAVPFPLKKEAISYLITSDGKIMVRIPTEPGEKLYGFGLQFSGIKIDRKVLTLNMDHWNNRGGGRTHAPVPFVISSRGYGVFFNTARFLKSYAMLGNRKDVSGGPPAVDRNPPPNEKQPAKWTALPRAHAIESQLSAEGLELVVFSGDSMLDVVSRYNLFCGGGAMPPLWGLGFWHRVHARFSAAETADEVEEFRKRNFPLDVIGLEPGWMTKSYPCTYEWQKKRFPDPEKFVQRLLDDGIRLNLWINPYISPDARIHEAMYPYAGSHLVWQGLVPDYNEPAARRILVDQYKEDHFKIGISGYKIDEVDGYDQWLWPDHATFPSGVNGETMRQTYGLLMQQMLYQDLFRKNNLRTYGNVRASNGAASGYPFVVYSDSYSHSEYITGISAASLCGILWTPEVRQASDDREWLNRMQTVCFSPQAKLDAWASSKKPWSYEPVEDAVRAVIQLRMQLLPYLYTAFADYHLKGIPPMRAMILEEGAGDVDEQVIAGKLDGVKDPYAIDKVIENNDQFMFGPSILVAPFYEKQAVSRNVRLPAGTWYDFYSGKAVGGGRDITVTAEELLDRIPLFVKEGAIIPMLQEPVNRTEDAYGKPLEIRIYGNREGSFDLYEDDGKTFGYQQGEYRIRRITATRDGASKLRVSETLVHDATAAMFGPISNVRWMSDESSQ